MSGRNLSTAVAVLACMVSASGASIAQLSISGAAFDRLLIDDVDGVTWARGTNYKASFSERGTTFIPFLGSAAPRNFPVTFTVDAVTVGGLAFPIDRSLPPLRRGSEVSIDRRTMTEVYLLSVDHIEQRFRFDRPAGAGDLVVRVGTESELAASQRDDGVIEFQNELGGVRYGTAIVFDSAGNRAPASTALDEGAIVITVDAEFLERATFPVTIDPAVSYFAFPIPPIPGALTPGQLLNADVAYDSDTGRYMVTLESVYSATDHDVYALAYTVGQAPPPSGPLITIDFTDTNWAKPKIANNGAADQFLVVAERTLSGGAIVVGGRLVSAVNFLTSAQFQISSGETGQKSSPDVGGDPHPVGPSWYCVTWQNTPPGGGFSHVYTRHVDANAGLLTSNLLGIQSGLYADSFPSVSKSNRRWNSNYSDWMIVFQRTAGTSNEDIWGSRVFWDGTVTHDGFPIDTSGTLHTRPQVSTVSDDAVGTVRYVAIYQEFTGGGPFGISDEDLVATILDDASTPVGASVNVTTLLGLPSNDDQINPCIDSDGTRFAIGFTQKGSPFATEQGIPYIATLHIEFGATLGVTELPVSINGYAGADENLQVTSAYSGGGLQYQYMFTHHTLATFDTSIGVHGAIYNGWSAIASAGPSVYFSTVLPSCGGLTLTMSGFPALGSQVAAVLSGYQGTPYLLIGTSISPVALCSGCLLGVDPNTAIILQTDSFAEYVPLEGGLVDVGIAIQGADIGSTGGCSGSPSFSLSEEIIISIL